jgi:hypothetical protein
MSGNTYRTGGPLYKPGMVKKRTPLEEMYEHTVGVIQSMDRGFQVNMNQIQPQYDQILRKINLKQLPEGLSTRLAYASQLMKKTSVYTLQPYVKTEAWGAVRQMYITLGNMLSKFLNINSSFGELGNCSGGSCGESPGLFTANAMYVGRDSHILRDLNEQYTSGEAAVENKKFLESNVDLLESFAPGDVLDSFRYHKQQGYYTGVDLDDVSTWDSNGPSGTSLTVPDCTNPYIQDEEDCRRTFAYPTYGLGTKIPNTRYYGNFGNYGSKY